VEVARWFHSRGHFQDGIFHIDLKQTETADGISAMVAGTFELPSSEKKDLIEFLRECRCLLLLDNMEEVLWNDEKNTKEFIDGILKFCKNVKLLVTSQREISGHLYEPEKVNRVYPLKINNSVHLFLASTKRGMTKQELKADSFLNLLKQLGGHPLSIVLMAHQLRDGTTIEDLVGKIKKYEASAISVKGITDRDLEHGESLVASLASAYDSLSEDAKIVFGILSMLPAGAEEFTIKQIAGDNGWEHVQELHEASLAEIIQFRRVVLLSPVRLFALSVISKEVKEQYGPKIVALMGDYANQFYYGHTSKKAKMYRQLFTIEEPNFRSATELPCPIPEIESELSYLGFLGPALLSMYIFSNRLNEGIKTGEVIITNLERIDDKLGEANTLTALGDLSMRTDDIKDARERYEKALEFYQQIDEKLGEANSLMRFGQLFALIGELGSAEEKLDNARTIYEKIDDYDGRADVHMGKAFVFLKHHNNSQAKSELEQCSTIRDKVLAHGEAAQWLIFYSDHLNSQALTEGAKICLEYAEKFAAKARDSQLQDKIEQRLRDFSD
jgi:tetratricopeptide (TPR) repeat protein